MIAIQNHPQNTPQTIDFNILILNSYKYPSFYYFYGFLIHNRNTTCGTK